MGEMKRIFMDIFMAYQRGINIKDYTLLINDEELEGSTRKYIKYIGPNKWIREAEEIIKEISKNAAF